MLNRRLKRPPVFIVTVLSGAAAARFPCIGGGTRTSGDFARSNVEKSRVRTFAAGLDFLVSVFLSAVKSR